MWVTSWLTTGGLLKSVVWVLINVLTCNRHIYWARELIAPITVHHYTATNTLYLFIHTSIVNLQVNS